MVNEASSRNDTNASSTGRSGDESRTKDAELAIFKKEYDLGACVGRGGFGQVVKARCKATGEKCAVKLVDIPPSSNSNKDRRKMVSLVMEEVNMLSKVADNEFCVHLLDACCTRSTYYLVTDLCEGGELLDEVLHRRFTEDEAVVVMRELLAGVACMHRQGVVHGDLKLENVLLARAGARSGIKICDFGLARELPSSGSLPVDGAFGSIHYCSPEVVNGSEPGKPAGVYDEKIDLWSVGVALYIMLSGTSPFYTCKDESVDEVFAKISRGRFSLDAREFDILSPAGRDLLRRLLSVDPEQRPSAEEALRHPFFASGVSKRSRSGTMLAKRASAKEFEAAASAEPPATGSGSAHARRGPLPVPLGAGSSSDRESPRPRTIPDRHLRVDDRSVRA